MFVCVLVFVLELQLCLCVGDRGLRMIPDFERWTMGDGR